jgi:glycosyltransferase involved in cell wall biosynthesis
MYRLMLAQASFVVVGNRTGAAEVVAHYGIDAGKCVPLPFPNPDFSTVEAVVPTWLPSAPYFFCPAQLWPHKNHVTLLRALALMPVPGDQSRRPHLVFTGTDKGNQAYLESVVAELGLGERVHFAGFVSRAELKGLYQQATALAFPSLLGPNNLPPQEAAVLGCPMILSDLPGHREQMGAGARYAGACDAAAWATEMQQLLGSPDLARALVALAREAVAPYGLGAYAAGLNGIVARMAETRQLWGA